MTATIAAAPKTASRTRKAATGTVALGASAAIAAAVAFTPGTAELGKPSMFADPALNASTSILGGIALDPEGLIKDIPGIGNPAWSVVKHFFGESDAIAIGPLALAAAASRPGQNATALAILGLAVSTTDVPLGAPLNWFADDIKGQVVCLGALTYANSSTDGACVNILGILDMAYDKKGEEVSVALTNPLALLTGGFSAEKLATDLFKGESLSRLLTDDFVRLSLGGKDLIKLTSDYALQPIADVGGGLALGWLGGTLVLFPQVGGNGLLGENVNYLGLPKLHLNKFPDFNDITSIIPSLSVGEFKTPFFGLSIPGWSTSDIIGSKPNATSSNVLARTAAAEPEVSSKILPQADPVPDAGIQKQAPVQMETLQAPKVEAPTLQQAPAPAPAPAPAQEAAPAPEAAPVPAPAPAPAPAQESAGPALEMATE